MKPYKHHELLTQIAKDAKVYDKPWELYHLYIASTGDFISIDSMRNLFNLIIEELEVSRKPNADQIIAGATIHTHQKFIDALNEGKTLDILKLNGIWKHYPDVTVDKYAWINPVSHYRIHDEYRPFKEAQERGEKVWCNGVLSRYKWEFDGNIENYSLTPPNPTLDDKIDKVIELLEGLKSNES